MENFTRAKPKVRMVGPKVFVYDDSWHAEVADLMIGIKNEAVTHVGDPDSLPCHVVKLSVGRGRRFRYVASDGEVYADLHGTVIPGYRTHRRDWCRQKGPWKVVPPKTKKLNMNAKVVVQAAIKAFLVEQFRSKLEA